MINAAMWQATYFKSLANEISALVPTWKMTFERDVETWLHCIILNERRARKQNMLFNAFQTSIFTNFWHTLLPNERCYFLSISFHLLDSSIIICHIRIIFLESTHIFYNLCEWLFYINPLSVKHNIDMLSLF